MVKTFQAYLPNKCHRTYSCVHCRAHLANHDELISKVSDFFFPAQQLLILVIVVKQVFLKVQVCFVSMDTDKD